MGYNSHLCGAADGAYRVAGIVRKDNFILSRRKRELFITPGRGELVTQAWNSHYLISKCLQRLCFGILFATLIHWNKVWFHKTIWSILGNYIRNEGPVDCCQLQNQKFKRPSRTKDARTGLRTRDKYSMRILLRQYFILYCCSIVLYSHLRNGVKCRSKYLWSF